MLRKIGIPGPLKRADQTGLARNRGRPDDGSLYSRPAWANRLSNFPPKRITHSARQGATTGENGNSRRRILEAVRLPFHRLAERQIRPAVFDTPGRISPGGRGRPKKRLGEISGDSPGMHKHDESGNERAATGKTESECRDRERIGKTRMFRREPPCHGHMGNLPERTLRQAKTASRPTRSGRNRLWRTGPNLGRSGEFRRDTVLATATIRRIASGRLRAVRSASMKR